MVPFVPFRNLSTQIVRNKSAFRLQAFFAFELIEGEANNKLPTLPPVANELHC